MSSKQPQYPYIHFAGARHEKTSPVHLKPPVFEYAAPELWRYVRIGLTYLESPKPLAPPEAVPPKYMHPDSNGI
jgi:hypothetical protein